MSKRTLPLRGPPKTLLGKILQHQLWLRSNGRRGVQLRVDGDVQFVNIDFSGVDLSHSMLRDICFERCGLSGVRFRDADLERAVFRGCHIEGSDFAGAVLRFAELTSNTGRAFFRGADVENVAWTAEAAARRLDAIIQARGQKCAREQQAL